jgi:hypothetical protein
VPAQEGQESEQRASDAQRETVAVRLKKGCVEGRITFEELEQRLERAMGARTVGELAEVVHDLPAPPTAVKPAGSPPSKRREPPGILTFRRRIAVPSPPAKVRTSLLTSVAPPLNDNDYALIDQSPNHLVFENSKRPGWTILVSILFFPFGLIALLPDHTERITISLEELGDGETMVFINGSGPRRVRKAFAQLTLD